MKPRRVARCLGVLFGISLLPFGPAVEADFAGGQRAYERGDFAAAFREWKAAADAGDPQAQYRLGELYRDGRGIPRDTLEWAHWWWRAAQGGHREARRHVAWPFPANTQPALACTPGRLPEPPGGPVVPVDYLRPFDFVITLHNTRLVVEQMVLADVENYTPGFLPSRPNLDVTVYRLEGTQRVLVARRLAHHGGSSGPYGDEARREHSRNVGPSDESASVSLRIPLPDAEWRQYRDQLLEALALERPSEDQLRQTRALFDHPGARTYFDNLFPNRPGVYEIECRYRSRDPRFWPGTLVAPPLRFEFVKRTEWIDALRSRRPAVQP